LFSKINSGVLFQTDCVCVLKTYFADKKLYFLPIIFSKKAAAELLTAI
jgi:hypothetical protein